MKNSLAYIQHEPDFKKLLNEKDPIDKLVLELAMDGKLKVGTVIIKGERFHFLKKYINNLLFYIGRHSS
jgi:hypothetical protein